MSVPPATGLRGVGATGNGTGDVRVRRCPRLSRNAHRNWTGRRLGGNEFPGVLFTPDEKRTLAGRGTQGSQDYARSVEMEHGKLVAAVTVVGDGDAPNYVQRIRTGQHELLSDEHASLGGADAGPNPFAYVLSGLGACTSITLRMYAER